MNTHLKYGLAIVALIASLAVIFAYGQSLTVAETVSTGTFGHDTIQGAYDACNEGRDELRAQGYDCEPCALVCPAGTEPGDTFSYNEDSTLYDGTYENLECSLDSGALRTSLLSVKSYCNNDIRVCKDQVGTADVIDTERTKGGQINLVEYTYETTNCETGQSFGDPITVDKYIIECNDGYFLNGRRESTYKTQLGECTLDEQADEQAAALDGTITEIETPDRIEPFGEANVRGVFKADADGRYILSASLREDSNQAFSIISASGSQDACGNDRLTAGTYVDAKAGDTVVFNLRIQAPQEPGTYKVHVTARANCQTGPMDDALGSVEVIAEEDIQEQVVSEFVADNPELARELLTEAELKTAELQALESCDETTDLDFEGCPLAECVDGEVELLSSEESEAACDDPTIASATSKATGNAIAAEQAGTPNALVVTITLLIAGIIVIISGAYLLRGSDQRKKR